MVWYLVKHNSTFTFTTCYSSCACTLLRNICLLWHFSVWITDFVTGILLSVVPYFQLQRLACCFLFLLLRVVSAVTITLCAICTRWLGNVQKASPSMCLSRTGMANVLNASWDEAHVIELDVHWLQIHICFRIGVAPSAFIDRLQARRPVFDSRQGQGIFLFTTVFKPSLGPHTLVSNGYQGLKLTTHLYLVQRLRMRGAIPPSPIRLLGVVFS
jgi:hypothetical protein